jgi:hypothetical protein
MPQFWENPSESAKNRAFTGYFGKIQPFFKNRIYELISNFNEKRHGIVLLGVSMPFL